MNKILKNIMERTVGETGEEFFAALVENLAQSMDVSAAWVIEFVANHKRLKSQAFYLNGERCHGWGFSVIHDGRLSQ